MNSEDSASKDEKLDDELDHVFKMSKEPIRQMISPLKTIPDVPLSISPSKEEIQIKTVFQMFKEPLRPVISPIQEETSLSQTQTIPEATKKRGRPPKLASIYEQSGTASKSETSVEIPIKKRRGRPPKSVSTAEDKKSVQSNTVKKPRGRPRESKLDVHLSSIIAKAKAQREARSKRVFDAE